MTVELRRAQPADAEFLLALVTGAETRPFLSSRAAESVDDVLDEIEQSEREPGAFGWFVFEADGERIGCARFNRVSERHRIAEVGRFAVLPQYRSRGFGEAAARALQRHVLADLDFHRLELKIYGFNERAIAHAERCGYVREGVKRRAYVKDGEWQDAVLFSLLREELDP
jgi:putative acetyltransferase